MWPLSVQRWNANLTLTLTLRITASLCWPAYMTKEGVSRWGASWGWGGIWLSLQSAFHQFEHVVSHLVAMSADLSAVTEAALSHGMVTVLVAVFMLRTVDDFVVVADKHLSLRVALRGRTWGPAAVRSMAGTHCVLASFVLFLPRGQPASIGYDGQASVVTWSPLSWTFVTRRHMSAVIVISYPTVFLLNRKSQHV